MLAKIGAAIAALLMFHPSAARHRLPRDYQAWSRVANCESGGWQVLGYAYPDSLGISRSNYLRFGGTPIPPGPVSRRERIKEIQVANRLLASYGVGIPDQVGCGAW
jgi:hypothetical protein